MAGRHTQTIDLGDVSIDNVLAGFDRDMAPVKEIALDTDQPNRGLELDMESSFPTINPAQRLNPQRPLDPANLEEPTELGLPPIQSQLTGPLSDLKTRLQDLIEDRRPFVLRLVLGLMLLGGFAGVMYYLDQDPAADDGEVPIPSAIRTEGGAQSALAEGKESSRPLQANPAAAAASKSSPDNLRPLDQQLLDNPYWPLPNQLGLQAESRNRLTAKQQSDWEFRLNHRFAYQQFKAIREIRAQRIRSSGYLLVQALDKPKFWMRINALFGLAEIGIEVDINTVVRAIGEARSSLVANYLRRFLQIQPNKGELFVLRQMIRVVDARSRLIILQVLATLRGEMNDLYVVGSNYDPSQRIQQWRQSQVGRMAIARATVGRYHRIIKTYLGSNTVEPEAAAPIVENIAVEEVKERRMVNEVKFFQELLDSEEDAITEPEDLKTDGFESLE